MARHTAHSLSPIAAAALLLAASIAWAQTESATPQTLGTVTVTGRSAPPAGVAGWGDAAPTASPLQANVFSAERLKDNGVQRLSDLVNLDPAVSDAYNAEGYWDNLAIRGYTLDNRFNFRRDGLPISAETSIPLDNKSRIEILKGTSGMQAGTSSPGGLVNFVVKRPIDARLRSESLEWRQAGSVTGGFDINQRFGADQAFGLRLNGAAAQLDPRLRASRGERHLIALAADWRVGRDTLLEAEAEQSHRSQPSQPGFSLLGNRVPPPGDPRISLNNQPWSLPVVMDAATASLRWQQRLGADWRLTAQAATQRLRTDDRVAFPFGCTDADGSYHADRYCPGGTFDLYDFRSDGERRRSDAIDVALQGKARTGAVDHTLTAGVMRSRARARFQTQANNLVGTGNVDGTLATMADATLGSATPNRDDRSTELYLRDAVALTGRATLWLGLRHTRLRRADASQSPKFTAPFGAIGHAFAPGQLVYASWGRGVESIAVPGLDRYVNRGQSLTAKSQQTEIGVKGSTAALEWTLAAFDIQRPQAADTGPCDGPATCITQLDGTAHHRGADASASWHHGAWTVRAGAQWLHARREGSQSASLNGLRPANVPARTLKGQVSYAMAAISGLTVQAALWHTSSRSVLPDNSAAIPGYTVTDAALRYDALLFGNRTTWRAGIDNLFDTRAWREAPYQFSHAYLYPLTPRTWRTSVQIDF